MPAPPASDATDAVSDSCQPRGLTSPPPPLKHLVLRPTWAHRSCTYDQWTREACHRNRRATPALSCCPIRIPTPSLYPTEIFCCMPAI